MRIKACLLALFISLGALQAQDSNATRFMITEVTVVSHFLRIAPEEGHRLVQLGSDSLKKFQAFNLAEALKEQTNLFIKSYGANGVATLSIRGTGANHSKVYWNGLDISPPNLGLMDLSLIQSHGGDNLELSYGTGAHSYGAGNLGAGLLINSYPDYRKSFQQNLRLSGGSFGRQQYDYSSEYGPQNLKAQSAISFGSLKNDFQYRNPGESSRSHQWQNADFKQLHLKQNLFWRPELRNLISLKAWYNQTYRQIPPNSLNNGALFDRMADDNFYLSGDFQRNYANNDHLYAQIGWVRSSNRFQLASAERPDRNDYQSLQAQVRFKPLANQKLKWETALQSRYDEAQSDSYEGIKNRFSSALYGRAKYLWNELWWSSLQLRAEHYDDQLAPLTGSISTAYQWKQALNSYLSFGRNYRMPSLNDLYWVQAGNPDLKAEKSYTAEWGLEGRDSIADWQIQWQGDIYWIYVDNWIQWTPNGGIWQPQNLKTVRNYGFEGSLNLNKSWQDWHTSFKLGYQYLQSQNLENEQEPELNGKYLAYNPSHSLNAGLQLKYKRWDLNYQVNYTDRYFLDEANSYYLPGYTLQDLQLSYRWIRSAHQIRFSFSLHNLADIDYQVIAWRPEPGLNYRFGIQWRWEKS